MEDFLRDMTSAELTGWFAYLQVDDEVKSQRSMYSIVGAFNGDKKGQQQKQKTIEDEEIIDTTDPKFAEQFKGFNYVKPQPRRTNRQTSTEVLIG